MIIKKQRNEGWEIDIKIIGAGLTGLSSYYHLKDSFEDIEIFEKSNKVGGLASSYSISKYTFDYAGHYLHLKSSYIKNWILELMKGKLINRERKSVIFSNNVFTEYPYQNNFYGLPIPIIIENLMGLIEAKCNNSNKEVENFYDWIIRSFGKGIAKNFMVPYNQKLWTVHPKKMNITWMGRFVPKTDIKTALEGSFEKKNTELGYNVNFYYPVKGGIGEIAKTMCDKYKIKVNFENEIESINLKEKFFITKNKEKIYYKKLISTIPINDLILKIKGSTDCIKSISNKLKSNILYLLNIGLKENKFSFNWAYFPELKYKFFRLGFYSNASSNMAPKGESSMYVETSFTEKSIIEKEKWRDTIIKQLIDNNFISSRNMIDIIDTKIIKPAYIIPDLERDRIIKKITSYLKKHDIYSIGRYGNWEYSAMEEALAWGKHVSETLKETKN